LNLASGYSIVLKRLILAQVSTVLTRIRERCARTSELPLLVRSGGVFLFYLSWKEGFLVCFSPPFPEEEILDSIAHRSLMRANTVELHGLSPVVYADHHVVEATE